jgi:hypothetical protein
MTDGGIAEAAIDTEPNGTALASACVSFIHGIFAPLAGMR